LPKKDAATNEEVKKLALEEAEQKARKAGAEADKAVIDARSAAFPAATTKGAEGKVELGDKVGMVADLVAHSMVDKGAGKIVGNIGSHLCQGETKILLVDSPDLIGTDWPYMAVASQIERERKGLEQIAAGLRAVSSEAGELVESFEVREEAMDIRNLQFSIAAGLSAATQAATSVVGGAADLVSLFRSEYEIKARDVTIGSVPLYAALANHLLAKDVEVGVDGFSLLTESPIFRAFEEAVGLRVEVQRLTEEVKASEIAPAKESAEVAKEARSAYFKALSTVPPPDGLGALKEQVKIYEEDSDAAAASAAVAVAEAAMKGFDAFAGAVVKVEGDCLPPLVAAATRERLHSDPLDYTHVLYAGIESAAGESITRRGALRRTRIRFIGGAQLSYLLWSVSKERLVAADTMPVLGEITMRPGSGFEGSAKQVWM
jgi:hypothetical protein